MQARSSRGFTLIEVVISVALVGALIAFFSTATIITQITRTAKYRDIALRIASSEIADLRAGGYDALPSSGSFSDSLLSSLPDATTSIAVSDYNDSTREVAVTVGWQNGNLATSSITLTTLVTETGGL